MHAPNSMRDSMGRGQLGWVPQHNPYLAIWQPAPVALKQHQQQQQRAGQAAVTVTTASVEVDLSKLANATKVLAVRYGWPFSSDTCCPTDSVQQGLEVCKPASCPILSAGTFLPLNPFFATIGTNGKCHCPSPQSCDM
jgi:hypothetical protein